MRSLELNLASRPFKNNTLLWAGVSLATLLLLWLSVANVRSQRRHVGLLAELEDQVGTIDARYEDLSRRADVARREIGGYDLELLEIKAAKANEVIQWKVFSWTRLFNQLEQVQPWDVQMASIHPTFRPQARGRSSREVGTSIGVPVSVEGSAKNLKAFLDLERALIQSPFFSRVEPDRTVRDEQTRETVFGLRFIYSPDLPEEPPPAPDVAEAEVVAEDGVAEQTPAEDAGAAEVPEDDEATEAATEPTDDRPGARRRGSGPAAGRPRPGEASVEPQAAAAGEGVEEGVEVTDEPVGADEAADAPAGEGR